jgi:predicted small integral membrane protein
MSDIIHTWRKPTSLEVESARLRKKRRDRFFVGLLAAVTIAIALVIGKA